MGRCHAELFMRTAPHDGCTLWGSRVSQDVLAVVEPAPVIYNWVWILPFFGGLVDHPSYLSCRFGRFVLPIFWKLCCWTWFFLFSIYVVFLLYLLSFTWGWTWDDMMYLHFVYFIELFMMKLLWNNLNSDTNCCEFGRCRHDRIDWGDVAKTNHKLY